MSTTTYIPLSIAFAYFIAVENSEAAEQERDISSVTPDLTPPVMVDAEPTPGERVKQVVAEYKNTEVYHALYLPLDWQPNFCKKFDQKRQPDKRYPMLVEYTGNGFYWNKYGDICTGKVEDSKLGYGISGGKSFIWVCMPYLNNDGTANVITWWGNPPQYNVGPTLDYCKKTVSHVCETYGSDPDAVILTGFSRGALTCNYLGLHDDNIAKQWLAFIPCSHYDGVYEQWPYPRSDRTSALQRLKRLHGRAQFICSESGMTGSVSLAATEQYLQSTGVEAPFTFMPTGFRNHNDAWVLRPSPARTAMRQWLAQVLKNRPGRP
ncbi:MAG: hypothetical protein ABIK07_10560 [Planctomycetota bacterium]